MTAAGAGTCTSQSGAGTEQPGAEAEPAESQQPAVLESTVSVEKLNLSGTGLRDWGQLRSLQCIAPNLRDLRLRDVPLTKELSADIARMLVIASLPSVFEGGRGMQTVGSETCGRLNGGAVSRSERRDAEVFAEKYWSGEWAILKKSIDAERRKLLGSKLDGAGAPGSSEPSSGAGDPLAASGGAAAGGAEASSSGAEKGDGGDVIASSMMPARSVFGTKHVQDLGRLG